MRKPWWVWMLAILALACRKPGGAGVTETEVKLGATAPATGPAAVYYEMHKAAKAYFETVNGQGGVHGRKISYVVEDDAYTPAKTVPAMRKLVEKDQVFAIFLPTGFGQIATRDYLKSKGVPMLFVSEGSTAFDHNPNVIRGLLRWEDEGRVLAQYVADTFPGAAVGTLVENTPVGKEGLKGAESVLQGKVKLLPPELYEPGSTNVDAQVLNLMDAKADVVLAMALTNIAVSAVKFSAQRQWRPKWVTSYVNVSSDFIDLGGEMVEGVVSGSFLKLPTDDDPGMEAHRQMLAKRVPGSKPSILTIFGQANAEFMVEALKRAGKDLTREGVLRAAESINDFTCSVCLYPIKLSATDHETFETMKLMEVKNGKWVSLGSEKPSH
jgi:branched-chain amino acid transport system substrate-binding protein